jgi:signal transduction histidine kinase
VSPPAPAPADPALAALVAADRWSLWRTLARGIAHHLANAAQMLSLDPTPPVARAEAAERVTLAFGRLREVTGEPDDAPVPVADALADLQELQRLQAGYPSTDLAIDAAPGMPAVGMPAADLRHALLALVTNAKEAAVGRRASIRVSAHAAGGDVVIVVEDDGPGVPAGRRHALFVPHAAAREGHLGLGLAVARRLAERAGGSLVHEPAARFVLTVPARRAR